MFSNLILSQIFKKIWELSKNIFFSILVSITFHAPFQRSHWMMGSSKMGGRTKKVRQDIQESENLTQERSERIFRIMVPR